MPPPPTETTTTTTSSSSSSSSPSSSTPTPPSSFTRLCIKNIPKHVDEKRLKAHFSARGQVTDAKLLRTKTGESRKMAFVGFKTEEEAKAAVKFFDKTFLDTSRLVVEAAVPRGQNELLARPWSRHSKGSSRFEESEKKRKEREEANKRKARTGEGDDCGSGSEGEEGEEQESPAAALPTKEKKKRRVGKEEFLATMMPRSRTQFWANDELGADPAALAAAEAAATAAASSSAGGDGSLKKKGGNKKEGTGKSTPNPPEEEEEEEEGESDDEEDSEEEKEEEEEDGFPLPAPPAAAVSDLDYLRSKVKKGLEKEVVKVGGEEDSGKKKEEEEDKKENEEMSEASSTSESEEEEEEEDVAMDEDEEEEEEEEDDEDEESSQDEGESKDATKNKKKDKTPPTENTTSPKPPHPHQLPNVEETGRLFIRNLPFTTTEDDLTDLLSPYGQVAEVHLPLDDAKRSKGFAFASFLLPENAVQAMGALDGQAFQGRLLHVLPAKEPPKDPLSELDPSQARTYKERKEIERRQKAGDERGWNASYLRSETVVDAVADRLQVAKGAVLDREGEGMAVKLALGETFLLAENKEFFKKEGVDLTVLESAATQQTRRQQQQQNQKSPAPTQPITRSKTTILVKNLPYSTTQDELTQLFGRYGGLSKVLLPPSRSLGLVDFLEVGDAKRAFKGLAYKRFQHVPLYLEWAPMGTFVGGSARVDIYTHTQAEESGGKGKGVGGVEKEKEKKEEEEVVEEEDTAEGSFTLFVKNLNFATTDEGLAAFFKAKTEGVRVVSIPKKMAPASSKTQTQTQTQTPTLSMGYGFVEYRTVGQAKEALRVMEGTLLEGHRLQCKLSDKRLSQTRTSTQNTQNNNKQKKRTKLVVRNVAFQATVKELKELFGSFGKAKTVRLPKKFDGSHRGFAFVEFLTAQEASNAFEALSSTHLYGKRLVIEWAEDKEDIGTLREKAGKDARKGAMAALSNEREGGGGGGGKKKGGGGGFDEGF